MELDGGCGMVGMVESDEDSFWVDDLVVVGEWRDELPSVDPTWFQDGDVVVFWWSDELGESVSLWAIDAHNGECGLGRLTGGSGVDGVVGGANPQRASRV